MWPISLLFILGTFQVVLSNVNETREIPIFLSPLDGEGKSLPRKQNQELEDDNHKNFKNVDNEYLGVESIKVLPGPSIIDANQTESSTINELPNEIDDELNSITKPPVFSDFFPFPPSDLQMELEKMRKEFGDSFKDPPQIVPFINKNKTQILKHPSNDSTSSTKFVISIKPRPFYPSWPIQDEPTKYEKSNKAISIMGEPRSTSPSDFNAILFTKTKNPITIVEAPNLAVIGKFAPRYRSRHPFHAQKSKVKKRPRKHLRVVKPRFPKRRKPFFGREAFHRGFNGKKRRVRQFYFRPSNIYFG